MHKAPSEAATNDGVGQAAGPHAGSTLVVNVKAAPIACMSDPHEQRALRDGLSPSLHAAIPPACSSAGGEPAPTFLRMAKWCPGRVFNVDCTC